MFKDPYRFLLPVLLILWVLAGCGLAVRPADEFLAVGDDYLQRLRWQDYNGVARYLIPAERQPFLDQWGDQTDLHLTEARFDSLEFFEQGRRARTRLTLDYYRLPSTVIQRLRLDQDWEYRMGSRTRPGQWLITSPFPPAP